MQHHQRMGETLHATPPAPTKSVPRYQHLCGSAPSAPQRFNPYAFASLRYDSTLRPLAPHTSSIASNSQPAYTSTTRFICTRPRSAGKRDMCGGVSDWITSSG